VVEGVLALAVDQGPTPARIIDPTCGGGGFLLAGLDLLVTRGVPAREALRRVAGLDIDPGAVAACRWSLALWALARCSPGRETGADAAVVVETEPKLDPGEAIDLAVAAVARGDSLVDLAPGLTSAGGEGPRPEPGSDRESGPVLVVGNPPFASPLKKGAMPATADRYRADRSHLLGPYADLAALHLLRAVETAPPGSTVALVQPLSVLSSRDAEGLRHHLDQVAPMRALWAAREAVFDAGVRTCAPVLAVGADGGGGADPPAKTCGGGANRSGGGRQGRGLVRLARGSAVGAVGAGRGERWSHLAAAALGAPPLPPMSGRLGDLAKATAGFRDEHYGLVAACREEGELGPGAPRLVTVGAVDPLAVSWGVEPFRFGGVDRQRPVIDRSALSDRVRDWLDRQLRPKVLLATQTKLLEPVVDRSGGLVPATPLIAVHGDLDDLDRVAAVLLAPPVVLWAWRQWLGAALTVDTVKLAARQVVELPLPSDHDAWDEAARLVATVGPSNRASARDVAPRVARLMTAAYGAADEVFQWWLARLDGSATGDAGGER
jgi:hypothetical protein